MAHKIKKKRVNLTPQQLMEYEHRKSIQKTLKRAVSIDQAPAFIETQTIPSAGTEKTPPPALLDKLLKPKKSTGKDTSLLLTVSDLCALLKVSRSSITRMQKEGNIPGRVKVGGSVRYRRETIENWLKEIEADFQRQFTGLNLDL